MKKRVLLFHRAGTVLLAAVLAAALPRIAAAGEVILGFDSDVTVRENGTQAVSETIRVVSAGKQIRHGIFRDFPLRSTASGKTSFHLKSVKIDGADSSDYRVERFSDRVRVRMGSEKRVLRKGEHTFVLVYETSGHLRFFDDRCEFGWNVTGDAWAFAIEQATCRITVPPDAVGILDTTGWVGSTGALESPIAFSRLADNSALFIAERPINPGEHFTAAISFPRHLVADPDRGRTTRSLVVIALTLAYFFVTWWIWGRDPKPGTIIPLFRPPEAGYYGGGKGWFGGKKSVMSPAAASYVKNAAFLDSKGFASLFVSLAAQGLCSIRKTKGDVFVIKVLDATEPKFGPLAEEEAAAFGLLLRMCGSSKEFVVSSTNAGTIQRIHDEVVAILGKRYATLWAHNFRIQAIGWMIVLPAGVVTLNSDGGSFFERLIPLIILAGGVLLVQKQVAYFWSQSINSYNPAKIVLTLTALLTYCLLRVRALSLIASGLWLVVYHVRSISVATIALVAIPMLFCPVMKAPSKMCRALLDKIDGLLMYVKTAEWDRLKALNPPEDSPETFERILPYAVAFGLEKTWCSRFASKLSFDAKFEEDSGVTMHTHSLGRVFRSGKGGTSFSGSLTKAVVPPSVAGGGGSFFGGGGRFGGGAGSGGGGGGGGGW